MQEVTTSPMHRAELLALLADAWLELAELGAARAMLDQVGEMYEATAMAPGWMDESDEGAL